MTPRASRLLVPPAALLAGAGALAAVLGERVVRPRRAPRREHTILAVDGSTVRFARDDEVLRPGRYGIYWPDGHAVVGPVLEHSTASVLRVLERVDSGNPAPGRVGIGHVHVGDPESAHGLAYEEVLVEGDAGAMPCWEVPAAAGAAGVRGARTWALLVHGYGGSRASTLDVLPIVHGIGLPAIAVAYRNDPGAPPAPDRRYHLGATEWRDLDAAMHHAAARGAERLLLMGWSMGGMIVMQAYDRSELAHLVAGIVLDCPVLDWRAILAAQGRRHHVGPLVGLASRFVEARVGTSFDELDWTSAERAGRISVPVLVFHGGDDPLVPLETSRAFAGNAGGAAALEVTPLAGHVGSWNVDPHRYEELIAGFCSERLGLCAAPAAD